MDAIDARRALEAEGLTFSRVEPVAEQGWASWTFELDGRFIVRFPRNEEIVEAMHREMRLLPALAAHVSFRVPVPVHTTEDWFVYERIPGRPFRHGDDVDAALAMIRELHTFPVDEARALLGRMTWEEQQAAYRTMFEREVLPILDDDLAARVREAFVPPSDFDATLVHYDLGTEHVLVDDAGIAIGIIDFEDAHVGDPAVDLLGVGRAANLPFTEGMRFYAWCGVLHRLVHHVREGQHAEIPAAVADLRRRLVPEAGQ